MAFVSDSFTDTDGTFLESHTGETGATWTIHPTEAGSTLAIHSGRAHRRTSSPLYYASGTPATAEYDVEVDLHVLTDEGSAGVCGRMDTTAATYYSAQHRASDDRWLLRKTVAGAITNLATYTDVIGAGGSRAAKLEIRDATKKLYVAGIERASSADNVITAAGRVGLVHAAAGSLAAAYHFDNLTATDAGGGGTAVTGILAASSGENTFSSAGSIPVSGQVSLTSVANSFQASGAQTRTGTLAAVSGENAFSSTGRVPVAGTAELLDAADAFSASGVVPVRGSVALLQAPSVFTTTGRVPRTGMLAMVSGANSFEASQPLTTREDIGKAVRLRLNTLDPTLGRSSLSALEGRNTLEIL